MINVQGFADGKLVYNSRVPNPCVPHEKEEIFVNGKWWRVEREIWENFSDVRLELKETLL